MIIQKVLFKILVLGDNILKFNDDPIKYDEKNERAKGIVSTVENNGAKIVMRNSFFISSNKYLKNNCFEGYANRVISCKENAHILNYMDLSEMKFEDIEEGDILIYDGNIECISEYERRIDADDKVLILKPNDLYKMALEQYKGIKEIKNVDIVADTDYIQTYHVKYLWGRFNFKSFRGDELSTIFGFQISDNTLVEKGKDNKYADIILKKNFEEVISSPNYGYVRDIEKIKYK